MGQKSEKETATSDSSLSLCQKVDFHRHFLFIRRCWFFLPYHILFNSFSNYFESIECLKCSQTQPLLAWSEFIIIAPLDAISTMRRTDFYKKLCSLHQLCCGNDPKSLGAYHGKHLFHARATRGLWGSQPQLCQAVHTPILAFHPGPRLSIYPSGMGHFHGRGQKYNPAQGFHTGVANVTAVHIPLAKAYPKAKAKVSEVGIYVDSSWILRQINDNRRSLVTARERVKNKDWNYLVAQSKYSTCPFWCPSFLSLKWGCWLREAKNVIERIRYIWVQVPVIPQTSCVILGKLFNLSPCLHVFLLKFKSGIKKSQNGLNFLIFLIISPFFNLRNIF